MIPGIGFFETLLGGMPSEFQPYICGGVPNVVHSNRCAVTLEAHGNVVADPETMRWALDQ